MVKAIVTDIEGTTTSVSFVYDVLFPYARDHLPGYVTKHASDPEIIDQLEEIEKEVGRKLNQQQAIKKLIEWMDEDRKITPLKKIQGLIWEDGYNNRSFTGHIYDDVPPNLQRWHDMNILLYVYSSGSIKAQKLLFCNTIYGDLTGYFTDFFDTTTGNKRECKSYQRITAVGGCDAKDILFLSDLQQELDAAAAAGLKTILVNRDGQVEHGDTDMVKNFDEIHID